MTVAVAGFYKFVTIDDPVSVRAALLTAMTELGLKGTILLATEGINGSISGAPDALASLLVQLRADARFADMVARQTSTAVQPFKRMKVKIKREIIRMDMPEADPTVRSGTYVAPEHWNALISEPDVVVLDTRNSYEVVEGTFNGAVDPKTKRFGEFPAFAATALDPAKHRKIAMFCTGGIRCEKASSYLKLLGFDEVYHLQGGILNYLASVPPTESLWRGKCYVFDERESVEAMPPGE